MLYIRLLIPFHLPPSISTLDVHQHIRYLDILVILIINHNLHQ